VATETIYNKIRILHRNFADEATITARSSATAYPISNIITDQRGKTWRSDTLSTTTLSAQLNAGDNTMSVVDATVFDSTGYVQVGTEIIEYQGACSSTDVLYNLVRGKWGTTAAIHVNGSTVNQIEYIDIDLGNSYLEKRVTCVALANFNLSVGSRIVIVGGDSAGELEVGSHDYTSQHIYTYGRLYTDITQGPEASGPYADYGWGDVIYGVDIERRLADPNATRYFRPVCIGYLGDAILQTAVNTTDTTFTVYKNPSYWTNDTDGFYSSGGWAIILDSINGHEAITYTGKTANTLTTITRGDGGTTAVAHTDGCNIIEMQHKRYYRIYLGEIAPATTYIEIGRLFLGDFVEFRNTFQYGSTISIEDLSNATYSLSGVKFVDVKPRRHLGKLNFNMIRNAENRAQLMQFYEYLSREKNFFIDLFRGHTAIEEFFGKFYVELTSSDEIVRTNRDRNAITMNFREVI